MRLLKGDARRAAVWAAVVAAGVMALVLVGAASALASPVWSIESSAATTVAPGGTLQYFVSASNNGDTTDGVTPYKVTIDLPVGIVGVSVFTPNSDWVCSDPSGASTVSCENSDEFEPSGSGQIILTAVVSGGASGVLTASAEISGGGAESAASALDPTRISSVPAGFGIDAFDARVSDAAGEPFTQAGGHPYAATMNIDMNAETNPVYGPVWSVEPSKDVVTDLPVGLVGNPTQIGHCTLAQLATQPPAGGNSCPEEAQIGVADISVSRGDANGAPFVFHPPIYNMVAPPGVQARFAINILGSIVTLNASVRGGSDYGVSVGASGITEGLAVPKMRLTFWGVPADPSHDAQRYCTESLALGCAARAPLTPLLRNPTSCGVGLPFTLRADSWVHPGVFKEASILLHSAPGYPAWPDGWGAPVSMTGCDAVPFDASLAATPTVSRVGAPSGLVVDVRVPQVDDPTSGIAPSDVRKTVVALPAGVVVNPSVADGLGACSEAQVGLHSAGDAECPGDSKIAAAEVRAPALSEPLEGSVYLARQGENPFGSLLAVYLVVRGSGVVVKVPGRIDADPVTGRLTATFDDIPQVPFSELKLQLKDGPRAPLVNPGECGTYTTHSVFSSWSGRTLSSDSSFTLSGDGNGAPCGPRGFSPSFVAGAVDPQAGAFSPFVLSLSRQDGEQGLSGLTVRTPAGLLGVLKSVTRCPEPQASQGSCGVESLIGHATAAAGAGPDPFGVQGGQVFLTGPYKDAPFGLSVVVPAKAGPFDLGTVVVRARVEIDPHTAQVTIVSDPLPQILQGIPLNIRAVNVSVDRAGFMFNPTNCSPLSVDGTITSAEGAAANVSSHFQAANCATLGFHPVFSVSTQAGTSKKNGASLDVKTTFPTGPQANIRSVVVTLPKQLPARLTTIQQACPEATFAANPAGCPAGSVIGTGTASTPILASSFVGPAYLVSHGGAAFPDVVVVFQSEGVTFDLVGGVNIRHGITTSSFASVPDAPISAFRLTLPEGPHSGLAAVVPAKAKGNMCGQSLNMPIVLTGQNGATLKETPKIRVTGCPKAKKKPKHRKAKARRGGARKG